MKKVYKKIIGITGAKGALGSHFIKKYNNIYNFKIYKKRIHNNNDFSTWYKNNKNIEIFIHLAGLTSVKETNVNRKKTILINTTASINIIKTINKNKFSNFKYFLFSSSSHVYKPSFKSLTEKAKRKPLTYYGHSKKKVEDYVIKSQKKLNFKIGIARIFNFYTNKHKSGFFIYDLTKKLKSLKFLKIQKINTLRDYIRVDQLCDIMNFMIKNKINRPLNVGSGIPLNLIKLVESIKKKCNLKTNLLYDKKPIPGLYSNSRLLKKLGYKKRLTKFILK